PQSAPGAAPVATPIAAGAQATPDGVPHLASPQNLPPGATMDQGDDSDSGSSPNVSYLKQLWHAVQNQDISGRDALLAVASQRSVMEGSPSGSIPAPPNTPGAPAAPAPGPVDAPAAPAPAN
ncbi:MAG: transglycosylase, partial [Mycobacterium sp.]